MSEMQVQYIAHSGNDLLVVNAARVSFAKESKQFNDKDQKLITYLAEHKHWLPFRHPQVTLRCKAPLPIARHLGKHATDGTEVIYCSLDPDPFTIKVIDTKVGKKK